MGDLELQIYRGVSIEIIAEDFLGPCNIDDLVLKWKKELSELTGVTAQIKRVNVVFREIER